MYIAGLDLPMTSSPMVEALVVLSIFDHFRYMRNTIKTTSAHAESKGGRVREETMPFLNRILPTIHAFVTFTPPTVYIGALILNQLRQPEWMTQFALSDEIAGIGLDQMWKDAVRAGACVAGLALRKLMNMSFRHLGEQWHGSGRRERPRVVQTGPYAWVRHPIYGVFLLQQMLWSVMFWSYVPLVSFAATIAVLAARLPIEEGMIQRDEGIKDEYREYKKKVTARVIPYIW